MCYDVRHGTTLMAPFSAWRYTLFFDHLLNTGSGKFPGTSHDTGLTDFS